MDTRRPKTDITDALTPEQAGPLLGHSSRHVRRLIARGDLEGTRDPYRTTRAAVDAYRFSQRATHADTKADTGGHEVRPLSATADIADRLVDGLMSELAETRRQLTALAGEVGRLEAELAQARREARGERRENGHRVGVLGRIGLWLRG